MKASKAWLPIDWKPEELLVARSFLKKRMEKERVPDANTVFQMLDGDMFPTLKAVFQAALTIPVSSCSCERSFSALRRLHTWLWRTMGQERLSDLANMAIERDHVEDIKPDSIIDRFALMKPCRHSLMLPPQKP